MVRGPVLSSYLRGGYWSSHRGGYWGSHRSGYWGSHKGGMGVTNNKWLWIYIIVLGVTPS